MPGKEVKIGQEPKATKTDALYIPSPVAGGHIGAREQCPLGYWVTGIRFKREARHVQADRVGVTGQCAFAREFGLQYQTYFFNTRQDVSS